MSILIKGMEMPKDGREHKALVQFLKDGISSYTAEDLAAYLLKTIENIPPAYDEEDRNG